MPLKQSFLFHGCVKKLKKKNTKNSENAKHFWAEKEIKPKTEIETAAFINSSYFLFKVCVCKKKKIQKRISEKKRTQMIMNYQICKNCKKILLVGVFFLLINRFYLPLS